MKIFGLIFWFCVLFIAYVYAGYPLIVAVLARLRRKAEEYAGHHTQGVHFDRRL